LDLGKADVNSNKLMYIKDAVINLVKIGGTTVSNESLGETQITFNNVHLDSQEILDIEAGNNLDSIMPAIVASISNQKIDFKSGSNIFLTVNTTEDVTTKTLEFSFGDPSGNTKTDIDSPDNALLKGLIKGIIYEISKTTDVSVVLPPSIDTLSADLLSNQENLISVVAPNVGTIEAGAFTGCTTLTELSGFNEMTSFTNIPSTVTSFKGFNSIPNGVTFPPQAKVLNGFAGMKEITDEKFKGNTNLTTLIGFENVTTIGTSAFEGCTNLTTISGFSAVINVESRAFYGCQNLTDWPDFIPEEDTGGGGGNVTPIPTFCAVQTLGDGAFYGCVKLTSIENMTELTTIGNSAFSGCTELATVSSFNGVTSLGNSVFTSCAFTEINGFENVTTIGTYVFSSCTNLETITGFNKVTTINANAFSSATNIKTINGFNALSGIFPDYFAPTGITNLTGFGAITSIPASRFNGRANLEIISGFDSVVSIETSAFDGCTKLTKISFSNALQSVGSYAFIDAPIKTLNLVGRNTPNNIANVCTLLTGKYQSGSITTFNFLLGEEILAQSATNIKSYVNSILKLEKTDFTLLNAVNAGVLDLGSANINLSDLEYSVDGIINEVIINGIPYTTWGNG
jgi:hypothetical protein